MKIDAVTSVIMTLGRGLARLKDPTLLRVLNIAKSFIRDKAVLDGIDELCGVIKDGPPSTTIIRRMLNESKYDEMRDLVSEILFFEEMDLEDL